MKYAIAVLIPFVFFAIAGCSTSQAAMPFEETEIYPTKSFTATPAFTVTDTPAPTLTLIPSPTSNLIPTVTSDLREKGYDIADIRFSYPRPDTLVIKFQYRLEQERQGKRNFILVSFPKECQDDLYEAFRPWYVTEQVVGEGQITFKMTLQGVCAADSIEFTINPNENIEANQHSYQEFVLQPYQISRDYPPVNSDTLSVENFQFTGGNLWQGVFTFDYQLSEEILIPPEEYFFVVRGFGPDGGCAFWAAGPILTRNSGKYQVPLDLAYNLLFPYKNCLQGLEKYTYTMSFLYLRDKVVNQDVYSQAVSDSYTLRKAP